MTRSPLAAPALLLAALALGCDPTPVEPHNFDVHAELSAESFAEGDSITVRVVFVNGDAVTRTISANGCPRNFKVRIPDRVEMDAGAQVCSLVQEIAEIPPQGSFVFTHRWAGQILEPGSTSQELLGPGEYTLVPYVFVSNIGFIEGTHEPVRIVPAP
jgi:hypothetical protein